MEATRGSIGSIAAAIYHCVLDEVIQIQNIWICPSFQGSSSFRISEFELCGSRNDIYILRYLLHPSTFRAFNSNCLNIWSNFGVWIFRMTTITTRTRRPKWKAKMKSQNEKPKWKAKMKTFHFGFSLKSQNEKSIFLQNKKAM